MVSLVGLQASGVQFNSPKIRHNPVTNLYHCEYTVTGNGSSPEAVKALGVGDTEHQAKRHAIVSYRALFPQIFLGIEEQSL